MKMIKITKTKQIQWHISFQQKTFFVAINRFQKINTKVNHF